MSKLQPTDGNLHRAIRAVGQIGRVLMGRQFAGRNLTVFPDDVFLVSYPRSGNTWTRFLIGNLVHQDEPVTFTNIESRIPEIYFNPDHRMRRLPRPRILKSHECFQPHYRQIIYIVRDPRDVAVSFYHHNVKAGNIPDNYPMEDFVPRFIDAEFDTRWGSWADHVQSWILLRQNRPEFLLLRYEDMQRDAMHGLARIAQFLHKCSFRPIDVSSEKLQRAVDLSSPESMRALEKEQGADWILTKRTRHDKPFVRSAKAGTWKSVLSPASVASIEAAWGTVMKTLGYDLEAEIARFPSASAGKGEANRTTR
jgi:Sulfotransferase domain